MQLNRFWSSVWSVASFLLAVGLLQYIIGGLLGLLGVVLPPAALLLLQILVVAVVPVVGALTYMDWRWNWKPEHIGMPRSAAAVWQTLLGLVIGAAAGLFGVVVSGLLSGRGLVVPVLALPAFTGLSVIDLVRIVFTAFATEMIFRGAVISRYQADLSPREVLLAATLTPFGWLIIQGVFRYSGLPTGMGTVTEIAMTVCLALLFLRTDSVWLSAGLRAGALVLIALMPDVPTGAGGPVVWGVAAAILLALAWSRQERMPRRVQPNRGSQRPSRGGRTIRGPWGPH
jgi:hypothetical protein